MYNKNMNIDTSIYNFMRDFHPKDDQVAVIYDGHKIGYREFFKEIDRVAAGLYELGVRKGDVVMIALPNIPQSVVMTYAVARIGGICSMIHPKRSVAQFGRDVSRQSPKVIVLSDINFVAYRSVCGNAKIVFCPTYLHAYVGLPHGHEYEVFEGNGDEPVFYMHSGGTSGEPKTIVLSSRAVNAMAGNLLMSLGDRFGDEDSMFVALPMFHGFGLCVGVHAAACTNMTLVLTPKFNAKRAIKCIAKHHITTVIAVPRMVQKMLQEESFHGENIASIKDVFVGGDNVSADLVKDFEERIKESGGKATLSPGYGLTETVSVCAVSYDGYVEGSLGKPLKDVEIRIVDDEMNEVPLGEPGELLVSTPQTMIGYFGDKVMTGNTIIDIDGKKWLKTGDIFRTDEEKHLFYLGRKKRLIKISGMNVFPTEIERVAQKLSFVKDCVAIECQSEGRTYIKLLVEDELTKDQKEELQEFIRVKLSHWSVPSVIETVGKLPRTVIGKIDFALLQKEEDERSI